MTVNRRTRGISWTGRFYGRRCGRCRLAIIGAVFRGRGIVKGNFDLPVDMIRDGFYGHARGSGHRMARHALDLGITQRVTIDMGLMTAGGHGIGRCKVRLVAAGTGKGTSPGCRLVGGVNTGVRLGTGAVTVQIGAVAVAGRALARQVVGIADITAVGSAVVGCCGEENLQAAIAGAGCVGELVCLGGVVGVAFYAGIGGGAIVGCVFLASNGVIAVGGCSQMALVAVVRGAVGVGEFSASPGRGHFLEVAIDIGAGAQCRCGRLGKGSSPGVGTGCRRVVDIRGEPDKPVAMGVIVTRYTTTVANTAVTRRCANRLVGLVIPLKSTCCSIARSIVQRRHAVTAGTVRYRRSMHRTCLNK